MPLGSLKLRKIRMQLLVRLPAFIALALRCVYGRCGGLASPGAMARGTLAREAIASGAMARRAKAPGAMVPGAGQAVLSSTLVRWPGHRGPPQAQLGPN